MNAVQQLKGFVTAYAAQSYANGWRSGFFAGFVSALCLGFTAAFLVLLFGGWL